MTNSYEKHYQKYLSVYEELATCNGGKTVWIPTDEHYGWYNTYLLDDEESEAWVNGYPNVSEPSILPDDLSPDVERTAYTTISYAKDEAYKKAYFKETDDGIEWFENNSQRLPDYGEICAWSLFVDIDIGKEFKQRPLPEEYKEIIGKRLELWTQAFSKMIGDNIEDVFALDSGGGMYVFTPPATLSPVYDHFEQDELNLIFNEIGKRMRSVTGTLNDLICEQDEYPKELFSADKVQNKNRQYKTVGSIHKELDYVVNPIDPVDINIDNKPVKSISDEDVERGKSWVKSFTDTKYKKYVNNVIEYLFQGQFVEREDMELEYIEGDDWKEILENWVSNKQDSIQSWEKVKENREKISETKLSTDITQDKEIAREAIRRVNNKKLKQYIINYLGESHTYEKNNEEMDFFPFWRGDTTESGRSAFYDYYEGKARFTDKADGTSRDIVYWVALEMTYDDKNYPNTEMLKSPGDELEPKNYSKCIKELRNRGENIPILVPEKEDGLSEWRIIKIGKELGIVDDEDIINSGSERKLKPQAWNKVLERLESENIVHNCNKDYPYTTEELENKFEKAYGNVTDDGYIGDVEYAHYISQHIENREEFKEFMDKVPNYVTIFEYKNDIGGDSINGFIAGTFINVNDDDMVATVNRIEPNPVNNINNIDVFDQLPDLDNPEHLNIKDIDIYNI